MKKSADTPQSSRERPVDFRGSLKDFEVGQLCYVVARRHQGRGPVRLILHKAELTAPTSGFGYGAFGHWVVNAGTLMGCSVSRAKTKAARQNGKLGGRPRKAA